MRRIWAPEWKYITELPRPHPQILFQIHIELEDHRFGSEKKTNKQTKKQKQKQKQKKKRNGIPFKDGKFSCLIYN